LAISGDAPSSLRPSSATHRHFRRACRCSLACRPPWPPDRRWMALIKSGHTPLARSTMDLWTRSTASPRHRQRLYQHPRHLPGGSARGKAPFAPTGDATGTEAAIGSRPRRQSRSGAQSWSAVTSFALAPPRPSAYTLRPSPPPARIPPTRLGFSPFPLCATAGEEGRRGRKGRTPCRHQCAAARSRP
jgi:hypothetical protein